MNVRRAIAFYGWGRAIAGLVNVGGAIAILVDVVGVIAFMWL